MAIVTTLDEFGNPTDYKVKESVADATQEVNNALSINLRFVAFTGEDDKQFTLKAKDISGIKDA